MPWRSISSPTNWMAWARCVTTRYQSMESRRNSTCCRFANESIDLAIFNSSLHYSSDYRKTIHSVKRCLRPDGQLVIIDSPVYAAADHGEQMRSERRTVFERRYGFPSDSLGSIEYLDEPALAALSADLGIVWRRSYPWYGWRWALRPWRARLKGLRPPSRFLILSGRFGSAS